MKFQLEAPRVHEKLGVPGGFGRAEIVIRPERRKIKRQVYAGEE